MKHSITKPVFLIFIALNLIGSSGCAVWNHARLAGRYDSAMDKYDALKEKENTAVYKSQLEQADDTLREAKSALRRWNHPRADVLIGVAEEQLDILSTPLDLPGDLEKIYEPLESTEPEPAQPL